MRVLFDQGTPVPLRQLLVGHEVSTAYECGWSTLRNGDLLAEAEAEGFDVLATTDKSLAILVLGTTSWPRIRAAANTVAAAVAAATPGACAEIFIP